MPVKLTVNPSPQLQIHYFLQRDIIGDDPFTAKIEPSEPAVLGVIINNTGSGEAKNVQIESAEPEIIENEKGLLIDFSIIGSSLNGKEFALGLNNILFGDIAPARCAYAEWFLESSLLGHFVDLGASYKHINSFNNSNLSLIDTLEIHNLIKDVEDNHKHAAYLVDDQQDAQRTPDKLYITDGTSAKVSKADEIKITNSSPTYIDISVKPSNQGWNYINTLIPVTGNYEIKKITRNDGITIPNKNVWISKVTFEDGSDPIYENRIHILDKFSSVNKYYYIISIEEMPELSPEVVAIYGIDETFYTKKIEHLTIEFNKSVDANTLTYEDISLISGDGNTLVNHSMVINQINDSIFDLDISDLTNDDGLYVLNISTEKIADLDGNYGSSKKSISWTQYTKEDEIGFSKSKLDFGSVFVGDKILDSIVVINNSCMDFWYQIVNVPVVFKIKSDHQIINKNDSFNLKIEFVPNKDSIYNGELVVDIAGKSHIIELLGYASCANRDTTFMELEICESELPYRFDNIIIPNNFIGDTTLVFANSYGCDSIVELSVVFIDNLCPPSLISPVNGYKLHNLMTTFKWNDNNLGNKYLFEISKSKDFKTLYKSIMLSQTSLNVSLDSNTQYF